MANYARIEDGRVAEVVALPKGLKPNAAFHPDVAKQMVPCGDSVTPGMAYDGRAFAAYVDPAPALPVVMVRAAQFRIWLLRQHGKTADDVVAAINKIADAHDRAEALISWEYEPVYFRVNPMWDRIAPSLGIADMDAAFQAANAV